MRLIAALAASLVFAVACSPPAAAPSPSPTRTASPTPSPTPSNVFKAELKTANEVPPITDAEASCTGTGTLTLTGTTAKFDVSITGCPASAVINIGHIHEAAAGANGSVVIDSTLKAGEITFSGGAVTFSRTNTNADPAVITRILANPAGFYMNFHSGVHPGGVIRGQLTKA
jgi:hypothetical protein